LRIFAASLLIFFVLASPLLGQKYNVDIQQFSVANGLSSRSIQGHFIGKDGFLWLNDGKNIQRYDGYDFKTFSKSAFPKILKDISSIGQTKDGWIWMMSKFSGRLRFMHPLSGEVLSPEKLLLPKVYDDLNLLLPQLVKGHRVALNGLRSFSVTSDRSVTFFDFERGIYNEIELADKGDGYELSLIDSKGNLWIDNHNESQYTQYNQKGKVLQKKENVEGVFGINDKVYYSKKTGKREELLLLVEDGLNTEQSVFRSPEGYKIRQILDEKIWCLGSEGWKVFEFSGDLVYELSREDFEEQLFEGLNYQKIKKGRFGKYYLASHFGFSIIEIRENKFTQMLTSEEGVPADFKRSGPRGILATKDSVLVSFEYGGLVLFDKKNSDNFRIIYPEPEDESSKTYTGRSLLIDKNNNYWVSGENEIRKFSLERNEHYEYRFKDTNYFGVSWASFLDANDDIWLGHKHLGISITNTRNNTTKLYTFSELGFDKTQISIFHFSYDKDNLLRACTDSGIYLLDMQKKKVVKHYHLKGEGEFYLPSDVIYHLHQDKDDNTWLGTAEGLLLWKKDTDEKRLFNQNDGLSNNVIYAVYEDEKERLWLSSNYGIMSFDKKSKDIQIYLPKDGLPHEEFNRLSHFYEKEGSGSGTIYFGSMNGIVAFKPDDFVYKNKNKASVTLSEFEVFDGQKGQLVQKTRELSETKTIIFKPTDRFLKLKFVLPNFEEKGRSLYAWTIDGVYDNWIFQKENSLQIGVLPYGEHRLRIKGKTGADDWSEEELTYLIQVLKPVYLRNWFIIMSAAALLSGIFFYLNWRTNWYKKRQQSLETAIEKATSQIKEDKQTIEVQAEELRQLDKVKSRFFANVSHELRTPLTLILGPIGSVLKSGELGARNFTLLKKARQGGKDLLTLVGALLDLSKMEASKMDLHEQPEVFYSLVRRIVSTFAAHAQAQGIKFTFEHQVEEDLRLNLDKNKLETILNNLLSNAVKFTSVGQSIHVQTEDAANALKIVVGDTGRGIHPDDLPHIFDRFYQSSQKDAVIEGGTGIGLAVSREFAELMGGTLTAESVLNKGSKFTFVFPKKEVLGAIDDRDKFGGGILSEKEETEEEVNLIPQPEVIVKKENTVLVTEDNPALRSYLKTILSPYYNVLTASNGQKALDILTNSLEQNTLKNPKIDLLVSDIMMPTMDGMQLLKVMKSKDYFRNIPVILLTARAEMQDKLAALRIGVEDYLVKPFEEEELLVRIENLLSNYQERKNIDTEEKIVSRPTISVEDEQWLQEVRQNFDKSLSNNNYSVSQLAYDLAISERQFRRRIKQLTGLSPLPFLKEIRLLKSRHLLEQKRYKTISQVATDVGFRNPDTFSRNFSQRFGKKPSDYLN